MIDTYQKGRITKGVGGLYTARDAAGCEYILRARGRFRREKITPLVGDFILFLPGKGEEHGWIQEILPRSTQCTRPAAANVELLIIVVAPVPAPDLLLADRLLVHARQFGMDALLCVNKCDIDPSLGMQLASQYRAASVPVISVSAKQARGMDALQDAMRGKLCCMAGQSAVGKSTLLNTLLGMSLQTGGLSEKISRGRHTTRHVELIEQNGLSVLDTPGFSLLTLDDSLEPAALQTYYPEYAQYAEACRFSPCMHAKEPDCGVQAAVREGLLHPARYERYLQLLEETKETWKRRYD